MWERRPRDCLVCLVLSQDHLSLFLHFISLCLTYQIHQPHWQIHRPIYKIRHSQIHRHKGVFGFESQPVAATLIHLPTCLSFCLTQLPGWTPSHPTSPFIVPNPMFVSYLSCIGVNVYLCFCVFAPGSIKSSYLDSPSPFGQFCVNICLVFLVFV